ncbi:MAG: putative peptidoglycan glycosyltransferase FtsW [Patescibacteria group bacterium]
MRVHKSDYIFLISIAVLLAFGLLTLFSASSAEGLVKFQDGYFFIKRQILLGVLPGLILFYFTSRIDYHWWRKFARPLFYFSLLLLVLLLIPGIGDKVGTAKSWFVIGGFSFQPAELLKLTLIFYLGAWLADSTEENFYHWREHFLRFVIVVAVFSFLILAQPDFGTLMILLLIAFAVYYSAGGRLTHLACLVGAGLLGVAGLVWSGKYGRLLERFTVFLNPGFDSQGLGYQISQALLAIGSGGIWGLGWGHSRQKFQYLPEVRADSIFAIIGEELGFLISALFIVFLIFIFWRGMKIAMSAPDRFGKIVVIGVMVWMIGQSFINIASMTGLLPLTGVPLPLVSHGGTALAIMLAALGVVVNVSKNTV